MSSWKSGLGTSEYDLKLLPTGMRELEKAPIADSEEA